MQKTLTEYDSSTNEMAHNDLFIRADISQGTEIALGNFRKCDLRYPPEVAVDFSIVTPRFGPTYLLRWGPSFNSFLYLHCSVSLAA